MIRVTKRHLKQADHRTKIMKVAVIGNTHRNLGAASAADLALVGHTVSYSVFTDQADQLVDIRARGGLMVQGNPNHLVSRRTGLAVLHKVSDSPENALVDAEVVLIDVPMPELEKRFLALIPHLPRNVVVHVQSHGYWPAARLTPLLRAAGRSDVLVTEAAAPTIAAELVDAVITTQGLRRGIEISTVPAARIEVALARLRALFPYFQAATSVLQTGLENINLMVHPAMTLLGIGLFEQAGMKGEGIRFYRTCNVPSAGMLADALDVERGQVCEAYGVRHKKLPSAIDTYYGTAGKDAYSAVSSCAFYQSVGEMPSTVWKTWMSIDVPYAIVPLVRLGEQAGVRTPLHRGIAEILGSLLGMDPWEKGLKLADMELDGTPKQVVQRMSGT